MFYVISICFTFLVNLNKSSSISVSGLLSVHKPNEPLLLLAFMERKSNLRSEGIFERFLRNLLELLTTTFPEKRLSKYCRTLYKYIGKLEYKYTRKLARQLRYMSKMYREDLKNELLFYLEELNKKKEHETRFLDAMNTVFTLKEHILFEDYIYDLKNYGTDDKLFIDDETDRLINYVIMDRLMKLSAQDRDDLEATLRAAVEEFKTDYNKRK